MKSLTSVFRIPSWTARLSHSVLDQAAFAGGMLVLNVLLVRWTTLEEYGAFAVLSALLLILGGIHNALIIEPMTVFGAQKPDDERSRYLQGTVLLHFAVLILIAAVGTAISMAIGNDVLLGAHWAIPFVAPGVLSFWYIRKRYYVIGKPRSALFLSTTNSVVIVSGTFLLAAFDSLSALSALILMGLSGLLVTLLSLGREVSLPKYFSVDQIRPIARRHWQYGKWALGESVVFALGTSIYPLLVALFVGLADAGEVRAVQLLFLPIGHTLTGISLVALPWLSKSRLQQGASEFAKHGWMLIAAFFGLSLLYLLPILLFGAQMTEWLYGDVEFLRVSWLIPTFGFVSLVLALSVAMMIILRAAENPRAVFFSSGAGTVVTLTIGVGLIAYFGIEGLMASMILSKSIGTYFLAKSCGPLLRKRELASKINPIARSCAGG